MKKQKKYAHLSKGERAEIEILVNKGYSLRDIAKQLRRNVSTISRELKRNRRRKRTKKGTIFGPYEAGVAQHKVFWRKSNGRYQGKKIAQNEQLARYISERLQQYWSPDEISGRMKQEGQPFYASKNTIYEWLHNTLEGWLHCQYLYSQRHQPRKRKAKKSKKLTIPNRISIWQRPAHYNGEYGHYEGDTFVSSRKSHSKHAVAVAYERKAKYADFKKLTSMKPNQFVQAMQAVKETVVMGSMTFDNGIENRGHESLEIETYFCDPYSSWQKGGVEKTIQMTRRFIPKGTDLSSVSQKMLNEVARILNHKPRKSLDYKTPYEIMVENKLFQNKIPASVALGG